MNDKRRMNNANGGIEWMVCHERQVRNEQCKKRLTRNAKLCFFVVTFSLFGHASIIYFYSDAYSTNFCPKYDVFCSFGKNFEYLFPKIRTATEWLLVNERVDSINFVKMALVSINSNAIVCVIVVFIVFTCNELMYGHRMHGMYKENVFFVVFSSATFGFVGVDYLFFERLFEMGKMKSVLYDHPIYIFREAFLTWGILLFWYSILLTSVFFFKKWKGMMK